jgi:methylmalonyl-CoA mutase C-terminal domain/subunit
MAEQEEKIRVLVAKPGLDGHDRGAKIVARALRDAGMEVIYTGLHQTPEQIAQAALQEDVDVVGLSILSSAHVDLGKDVVEALNGVGLGHVLVIIGGNVPLRDYQPLRGLGITGIFPTGAKLDEIADFIASNVRRS